MDIKKLFNRKEEILDDSVYLETIYIEVADVLSQDVCVVTFNGPQIKHKMVVGLWDTGAHCSCISSRIVKELGLKPIKTKERTSSAFGITQNDMYIVDVYLTNHMIFKNVKVKEAPFEETSYDFLIGMDIIKQGNFQVLIENEKTVLKFQRVKFE